ncbi:MAG: metallophosphoesterase [Geminicoccaceae bacterium]|nr:metallophosphoesterase [Geminicoccaceae bacterium]
MSAVFRLAHLTDVHLGPLPRPRLVELCSKRITGFVSWHLRRRHLHRPEVLEATLAALSAERPDHTVVTGDLVNISLPGEYAAARRWLERLGSGERVTVIPGNHDAYVPGAAEAGWPLWRPWMADARSTADFPFVRRIGPVALVGLSSAVPRPWGDAAGALGRAQLEALAARLAALRGSGLCRVLLVHHPPVAGWSPRRKALLDAPELCAVLAREGADLVLCGHDHRLASAWLPGADGPVPVLCAPSASLRAHEPERRGGAVIIALRPRTDGKGWSITARALRFDPDSRRILREEVPLETAAATALAWSG